MRLIDPDGSSVGIFGLQASRFFWSGKIECFCVVERKIFLFETLLHNIYCYFRGVKSLACITLLYIAFLCGLPCSDHHTESDTASGTEQHHDHGDAGPCCSPFCSCTCCGAHFMVDAEPVLFFTLAKCHVAFSVPHSSSFRNDSSPIWQPPKIS